MINLRSVSLIVLAVLASGLLLSGCTNGNGAKGGGPNDSGAKAQQAEGNGGVIISGGGNGVQSGDHIVLLDFFEHGLTPALPQDFAYLRLDSGLYLDKLPDDISPMNIRLQIQDVSVRDPVFAVAILKAIQTMMWYLVDQPLRQTAVDTQVVAPALQIASRNGLQVLINQSAWNQMDEVNRLGLIIHEAVSSLSDRGLETGIAPRMAVAAIFDSDFYFMPHVAVQNTLRFFPSVDRLTEFLHIANRASGDSNLLVSDQDDRALKEMPGKPSFAHGMYHANEFAFAPLIKMRWASAASPVPTEETLVITADTRDSALEIFGACNKVKADKTLVSIEVGAYYVEVETDTGVIDGQALPRMNWQPVYRVRSRLSFKSGAAVTMANCGINEYQQMNDMSIWLRLFDSVY